MTGKAYSRIPMGPFDRFNDRAKRVLALAQDEAIRFNHNYIGPSETSNPTLSSRAARSIFLDDAAKRVLSLAEEEARQMRHNWIGTEHMLIALVRSDGVAQRTLKELGVTLELARAGVFKAVTPAENEVIPVTVTPRVTTLVGKAIMLAAPQSDRVRPQHLLLALVADPDGIGSQVLTELGDTREGAEGHR